MSDRIRMLRPIVADAIYQPRPSLNGRDAVERLADDMRVANARNGSVTRDDLSLIGWTPKQLDTYGERARIKAATLSGAA